MSATTLASATPAVRKSRLGLRTTPEQEAVLRQAAELTRKSLKDFVLDAACQAADQVLLDQRLFVVSGRRYQALLDMLDGSETDNAGLADLYSHEPPWSIK